ncbi:MAG: sugar nucleotide-binding protein [Flavobacteriaceae bacterium]|nr:sugar nucleotide-binding protein [Flavobacteriaceae bacterium]
MKRILILGASGNIGHALYKELCPYFDVHGTYCSQNSFRENRHFHYFDAFEQTIFDILDELRPSIIISAMRGDFVSQIDAHLDLITFAEHRSATIVLLSSANVFDAFINFPSYEYDKTLSESIYGRFKIKIENALMQMQSGNFIIARIPMVFGSTSYRIRELKQYLSENEAYEVFPNLVINVASIQYLCIQLHYMINRERYGIFHLGSENLIHHEAFIEDLLAGLDMQHALIKKVYTSNEDRYLAVLPKDNKLPKHLQYTVEDVIQDCLFQ